MHHAGAKNFHPPGSLAGGTTGALAQRTLDIHFRGRLGEREKTWPEARTRRAKKTLREVRERRLQINKADPLIDAQPLDLREHRRVRRVEEITTIGVAR